MTRNILPFLTGMLLLAVACQPTKKTVQEPELLTDFVNPFIGTAGHGHTYPGAAYPFGQIQLSPDNGVSGWDWCSGYHYSDSIISGFSHLHLSGTGIGDLADISFLPVNEPVSFKTGEKNTDFTKRYAASFSHDDEMASPGYYAVTLLDRDVRAEMTVTERTGWQRYTFPDEGEHNIMLNLGFAINWDKPYESEINVVDEYTVTGRRFSHGWAADQHVFFVAKFSAPIKASKIFDAPSAAEKVGVFTFGESQVMVKVAVSSVSVDDAMANLSSAPNNWDFDSIHVAASDAWEKELEKIRIKSDDPDQKTTFYTALYHTMVAPALFSDKNGDFKGVDGSTLKAKGYNRYTVFSLWDTYRALHPLFTVMHQSRVNDMVKTMLDHYKQTGLLPVWELEGNETFCMVGNSGVPVVGEAILKNIGDFNREEAYEAMKNTMMSDRDGLDYYKKLGYIPADKVNESVSKLLEYAIDDYSVALVAKKLGKTYDYNYFLKRSQNFRNIFDPKTGFFRGKNLDGSWTGDFDPAYSKHRQSDYTEGNAWQYLWEVPQDVPGLIDLLGGKDAFANKLDTLFALKQGVKGAEASPDISGLIGGYAQGNEPGHHITYLFNYAGRPWRTQELNRQIQTEMYYNAPDGLCGNEDCGQMSAWYVFSAMGFYPVSPSDQQYQLGSPIVQEAQITVAPGKVFTMKAPDASEENLYVQSVKLNGQELHRSYITQDEIMNGDTLVFEMGPEPNKHLFQ